MPIEIYVFPTKEREIRQMYDRLLMMAKDVGSGRLRLRAVYDEWDRQRKEILNMECALKSSSPDAEHCFFYKFK
jgi:hypothetical protein